MWSRLILQSHVIRLLSATTENDRQQQATDTEQSETYIKVLYFIILIAVPLIVLSLAIYAVHACLRCISSKRLAASLNADGKIDEIEEMPAGDGSKKKPKFHKESSELTIAIDVTRLGLKGFNSRHENNAPNDTTCELVNIDGTMNGGGVEATSKRSHGVVGQLRCEMTGKSSRHPSILSITSLNVEDSTRAKRRSCDTRSTNIFDQEDLGFVSRQINEGKPPLKKAIAGYNSQQRVLKQHTEPIPAILLPATIQQPQPFSVLKQVNTNVTSSFTPAAVLKEKLNECKPPRWKSGIVLTSEKCKNGMLNFSQFVSLTPEERDQHRLAIASILLKDEQKVSQLDNFTKSNNQGRLQEEKINNREDKQDKENNQVIEMPLHTQECLQYKNGLRLIKQSVSQVF